MRRVDRTGKVLVVGLAALVVAQVLAFARQGPATLSGGNPDLKVYMAGARILASGERERLYDWPLQQRMQLDWPKGPSPYLNPPFVAAAFVPLLGLSRWAAYLLTAVLEALALVAAMLVATRLAGMPAVGDDRAAPWVLPLAALAHPVTLFIWLSVQPAPLVTLVWAGFAAAWVGGRREVAACWLLAGLAVKPHLVLPLALFLLVSGPARAGVLLAAGAAALGLAAWAMVGTEGVRHYAALLRMEASSGHHSVNAAAMVNLRGLLALTFGDTGISRAIAMALSLAVLTGIAWAARLGQQTAERRASLLILALSGTMLAGYHMHVQELNGVFLLLALAAAAGWLARERLPSVALYLVAGIWAVWHAGIQALWALVPLSLIGLYFLGLRRAARDRA